MFFKLCKVHYYPEVENLADHWTQKIMRDPENYEVPRKYFKPTQIKNGFVHLGFPDNILCCTGNLLDKMGMMKAENFH